jgi:hypothetical protein
MSKPLTNAGDVKCGHQGKAVLSSTAKLKVSGQNVLLKTDVMGKTIAGCSIVLASDMSGVTDKPCLTVASVTAGEATKLKVGGFFVILDDQLAGTTDGMQAKTTPLTALSGSAQQNKLKAV